jgi:hypothetical protein
LTLTEVAEPAAQVGGGFGEHLGEADASGSARQFPDPLLEAALALVAIRRLGSRSLVKLNPRNFLRHGWATALFSWFTLSLSRSVMKRVTLFITRCPARSLAT